MQNGFKQLEKAYFFLKNIYIFDRFLLTGQNDSRIIMLFFIFAEKKCNEDRKSLTFFISLNPPMYVLYLSFSHVFKKIRNSSKAEKTKILLCENIKMKKKSLTESISNRIHLKGEL